MHMNAQIEHAYIMKYQATSNSSLKMFFNTS